jgi:transposase
MIDISDDAKGGYQRIELLTGPGRRRRWSVEEKARIIEETLAPGARVSDVARCWQLSSQQVFTWRREARIDQVTKPNAR